MSSSRIVFLDAARGLAIILVAFGHATMVLVDAGLSPPQWYLLSTIAVTLRMPLFFAVAGMLATGVVRRSWRELWNRRITLLLWIILVWTAIRFLWFTVLPIDSLAGDQVPAMLLISPIWTTGMFWFLQALVLFLIAGKLLIDRVPAWAQIAGAAVLSAVALGSIGADAIGYQRAAAYFVFFLLGLHGRPLVTTLTARRRPLVAAGLLTLVVVATGAVFALDLDHVPGVLTVLGVPAVIAALCAVRAVDGTHLSRLLVAIGRRTLPVFVLHMLVIGGLTSALLALPALPVLAQLALPPVVGALSVAASLAVWRLTRRVPWLYEAPAFLTARVSPDVRVR